MLRCLSGPCVTALSVCRNMPPMATIILNGEARVLEKILGKCSYIIATDRSRIKVPCCIRIFVLELVQVIAIGYIVHSMGSSLWRTPQCGILELRCDAGNQPSATFLQFLRCVPRLQTCALPPPNHDQIIPAVLATLHTRLILCSTRPQSQSIEPHHLC
jgi:hypothetical protein